MIGDVYYVRQITTSLLIALNYTAEVIIAIPEFCNYLVKVGPDRNTIVKKTC